MVKVNFKEKTKQGGYNRIISKELNFIPRVNEKVICDSSIYKVLEVEYRINFENEVNVILEFVEYSNPS